MAVRKPMSSDIKRRPKEPLIHVWAPKLGRPVVLANHQHLHFAILLEANPNVSEYCERPRWPEDPEDQTGADFWMVHRGVESRLNVRAGTEAASSPEIRTVTYDEILQHRQWIQNWLSLINYVPAERTVELKELRQKISRSFGVSATFQEIELHFSDLDATAIRSGIVDAIHRGELICHDLEHRRWDLSCTLTHRPPGSLDAPL